MSLLPEVLKDPTWQFAVMFILTVVVAVATIIIPWLLARSKTELSYRILTNTSIVNVRGEYQRRIEIRFLSRRVQNVHLIIFQLSNSGHKAIKPEDYAEPVTFRFGEESRILTAELVGTSPPELKFSEVLKGSEVRFIQGGTTTEEVEVEVLADPAVNLAEAIASAVGSEMSVPPILLNAGDWIKVNILVSDYRGPVTVSGRVVDVKKLKEGKDYSIHLRAAVAFCVFVVGMLISSVLSPPLVYVYIAAVSVTLALVYVFVLRKLRRREGG